MKGTLGRLEFLYSKDTMQLALVTLNASHLLYGVDENSKEERKEKIILCIPDTRLSPEVSWKFIIAESGAPVVAPEPPFFVRFGLFTRKLVLGG